MGDELYEGYDRVSAILDTYQAPDLIDWKIRTGKKEARRISTIATRIGSNVDEYIKAEILGAKLPKLKSTEAENCVKAWKKWKEDYGIKVKDLAVGKRLFDEEIRICGEPDILMNDEVLDIKCSSAIRQNYWIQTQVYADMLGFRSRSILRLDKNLGCYSYEKKEICDEDREVFKALTIVYRYFKPQESLDE
jgi:hypothetical protein